MKNLGVVLCSALGLVVFTACSNSQSGNISLKNLKSFTAFVADQPAPASDPNCDAVCTKRRQEFSYVVYVGKQIYCYWDIKKADTGLDFDALATKLQSQIVTQTSFSQYYKILRTWASSFHDGHVNVMATGDLTQLELYSAPVRVVVLGPATDHEKVVIAQVLDPSSGATVGDEVTAVNDVAVKDAVTNAAAEASSGSTERMRRWAAARRLTDVLGTDEGSQPLKLTLRNEKGETKDVVLARSIEVDTKPDSGASTPTDTGEKYYSAKILPGGWGYFRLDAFQGTQDEQLISQLMDRLSGTQGLILDLRKNGGGDLTGDKIISRLITSPVIRYKRSERLSDYVLSQNAEDMLGLTPDPTGLFAVWHDLKVEPASTRYTKPVVALISPYCFSACDTFSAALKGNNLATLIGEATGGGTGTPLVFQLPVNQQLSFRYSVIRGQKPDGSPIEGVGTQPDVFIEPTVDDLRNHDGQLDKAIAVLNGLTGKAVISTPTSNQSNPTLLQRPDISPTHEDNQNLLELSTADSIGG